jgi:fatty-acyl-CoA synthase
LCRNHRGFVINTVAAIRTGADVVLLNTEVATPQLRDILASEHIGFVLHDEEFAPMLGQAGAPLSFGPADCAAMAGTRRPPGPRPAGRIVLLTAGTTGRPKGAVRSQQSQSMTGIAGIVSRIPFQVRDTQMIAAPLFHGWGFTNLVLGFGRCATTLLPGRFDAENMLAATSAHQADVLVVVPVMLQRLLALGGEKLAAADTSCVRIIASSGSPLGGELAAEMASRFGPVLYNVYGSTETAVATIATPEDLCRAPTTVGRPVIGVRVQILDAAGKPLPPGETGRVFVGSPIRFNGYTGGGGKEQRDGLLSTGDLGHFDAGLLFIDGREDDMIISGGENVFPAEVEEILARHPGIAEVAVAGVTDPDFGQSLAAFVVRRPDCDIGADDVRQFVRDHLARYKVPRRVDFLAELPRSAIGKVQKRKLVST